MRKLQFMDPIRCTLPYCGLSEEYKLKFSRRINVECHFRTPTKPSPLMIFGHGRHEHYHELCERIAHEEVHCCLVELEDAQDEWDYIKDMMLAATEVYEESRYADSVFLNMVTTTIGFIGTQRHASEALLAMQMPDNYPEYVDSRFTYHGYILLSPSMAVKGILESLRPVYKSAGEPMGETPNYGGLLVIAAGSDCVEEPKSNALPIYSTVNGCKTYLELVGGSHCYYSQNVTHVTKEEGYNGWLTESAIEEREACLLRENQCIDRKKQIEAPPCRDKDCSIHLDPGKQKEFIRRVVGHWVRWIYYNETSAFQEMSSVVLAASDYVTYNQRSCEIFRNLP